MKIVLHKRIEPKRSNRLSELAGMLQGLIGRFRVEEEEILHETE